MTRPEGKDYLTGFSLRGAFHSFSRELLHNAKLRNRNFSIVLIDLDNFKKFNDTFGHPFGDEILKYAADNMRLSFQKSSSTIFRYGGDEFIAVLPDTTPKEALYFAEQYRYNLVHPPYLYRNKSYRLTISCGISAFPDDGQTTEQLFKKADEALYYSKRRGRNRITLARKMKASRVRNLFLMLAGILTIIGLLCVLYQFTFKGSLHRTIGTIRNIQITATPKKTLDIIVLKKGTVFKGKILKETNNSVLLDVHLKKGSASLWLRKSEIANIEYGLKPTTGEK
jgi:diguanylate cyclase (GGDEF)-like protein